MWGALSLLMTLIPTFRDFRLLNVIAIAGTGFTAVYIWVTCHFHGFQQGAVNLAPYNMQVCRSSVFMAIAGCARVSYCCLSQNLVHLGYLSADIEC